MAIVAESPFLLTFIPGPFAASSRIEPGIGFRLNETDSGFRAPRAPGMTI
ncbi:MAG TPA: hypothetical protein VN662_02645 [Rhodanobacteraceae bacterium]|nr:hypothetical protein [Rhodanobacteraceae bacterium]